MNPRLPPKLAAALAEMARVTGCDDWKVVGRQLPRRAGTVVFLDSPTFRVPRVVLKIFHETTSPKKLARAIHKSSRRYFSVATAAWTVPEPIAVLPDSDATIAAFIDAPLAGDLVRRGLHTKHARDRVNQMSAQWLRWFHERGGLIEKPWDAERFTSKMDRLGARIEAVQTGALKRDLLLSRCLEMAQRVAGDIAGTLVPHAPVHWDFTPFNLFIRGETVVGFDYTPDRNLPVTFDICRFLFYMDLQRLVPAGGNEIRARGCREADLATFGEGYGMSGNLADRELWLRFQFLEITRRMTTLKVQETHGVAARRSANQWRIRRNAELVLEALGAR